MIRLEQVQRVFQVGDQAVHALDGVDLTIEPGEYVSIMGPSGSGKSTLLNILGLLDRPDAGRYLLEGRDVTDLTDAEQARVRRNQIGFVFQFFHLIPRMTAAENVELPLVLEGVEPGERRRRVDKVLEAVGLSDRARHRPDQLSGGQRQRVA
ncbi:MAG: ABC transporter ATP-binding protein, partial [Gammaproteobacteria bacterium]